jgi:predicted nucleic acid-binding protein
VILADTGVLIDQSFPDDEEVAASILSRAELALGVALAKDPEQADRRRALLFALDQVIDWLPFDRESADVYGELAKIVHAHAPAKARRIDTFIAAQAKQHSLELMTTNSADFAQLEGHLKVRPVTPVVADQTSSRSEPTA